MSATTVALTIAVVALAVAAATVLFVVWDLGVGRTATRLRKLELAAAFQADRATRTRDDITAHGRALAQLRRDAAPLRPDGAP